MKHVSRFWAIAAALTFATVAAPAFAEVQNIRIGGDLTVRGFWRDSLHFQSETANSVGAGANSSADVAGAFNSDSDRFFQSGLGINIGADLTDNVSVDVRLINQRVMGGLKDDSTAIGADPDANQIDMSLAYVTLKELFYSPLTLKIGRQNLWYGRGMIVGHRLLAGDTDPKFKIPAGEYTDFKGFDAMRAILDFDPVTVDFVYAKVHENEVYAGDDEDLWGLNLGYVMPDHNAEVEAYYFLKRDDDRVQGGFTSNKQAKVNTIGIRGSIEATENLTMFGEAAYQFGNRDTTAFTSDADGDCGPPESRTNCAFGQSYSAWMLNAGADYVWADADWTPRAGIEYRLYSGNEAAESAITGWDGMYRGNYNSLIRDFQTAGAYIPQHNLDTLSSVGPPGGPNLVTAAGTNQQELQLRFGAKPMEDLDISSNLTWYWSHKGLRVADNKKDRHFLGTEWDTQMLYDYTEDVQFGVIYGVLWPGDVFESPTANVAQEMVTTVKVAF